MIAMSPRRKPRRTGVFTCLLTCLLVAGFVQSPAAAESLTLSGEVRPAATRAELLRFEPDHESDLHWLAEGFGDQDPVATAAVSRDGSFALDVPAPGLWRLRLSAPGRVTLERSMRPLTDSAVLPPVELPADAGLPVVVLDPAGRPLAGARAWVRRSLGGWNRWRQRQFHPVGRFGVSDERGRLVLPRLAGEPLVVQVWAPGLPVAEVTVQPEDESAEIRFAAGLARPLQVRGADGEPVAGVIVRLDATPLAVSGENGDAEPVLADGAAAEVELVAADGRRAVVRLPAWEPANEEARLAGPPLAALTLPPPRPLAGRVVDATSERAVPGAVVWIWNLEGEAVEADGRGAFSLPWPVEERTVVAVAPGYRWQTAKSADLEASEPVVLALAPALRIAGRAVDEAGEPVAAARVRVRQAEDRPRVWSSGDELSGVETGVDGGFVLRGVNPGRTYELRVEAEGLVAGEVTAAAGDTDLEVVLATASGVVGRVLDPYGGPLSGARVRLFPLPEMDSIQVEMVNGERQTDHEVVSGPRGRFAAGRLAAGIYDLEVLADGWAPLFRPALEVPEEGDLDLGDLLLDPGATIEGRVIDAEGRSVEGAEVRFHSYVRTTGLSTGVILSGRFPLVARSGFDGRFAIEHQPEDRGQELVVSHPSHLDEMVTAQPGDELVVRLRPAGGVFGRVVSADGAPLPGAHVEVQVEQRSETLQGSSMSTHFTSGRSGEDGTFNVVKVPPGQARVKASATGYAASEPVELEIAVGQRAGPLRLVLSDPAVVFGQVLDLDGAPAAGAEVRVTDSTGSTQHVDRGDAEGRYRVAGLASGVAEVWAQAEASGARVTRNVELRAGEQRLDLRLAARPAVGGRVVDGEGRPVAGASVSVEPVRREEGTFYSASGPSTGSDGSFLLALDRPGAYRVEANAEAGVGEVEVEVGDEPRLGVVVELRRLGGSIVGDLVAIEPEAAAEVTVYATPKTGGRVIVGRGTASGSYRVHRVPAGDWVVRAEHTSTQRQALGEVRVGDGEAVLDLVFPPEGLADAFLEGRILGSGRPVSGLQVGLVPVDPSRGTRPAATEGNAGGRFRFDELVAGRYQLVVAGFAADQPPPEVEVGDGEPLVLDLPSVPVAGRVLSPTGQPLGRVWLALRPADVPRGWVGRTFTGPEGAFRFEHVLPGRYVLSVQSLDGSDRQPVAVEMVIEAPGRTGLEIVLE